MEPKVTFVVPCYNLANLLPECVNSILTQTFEDYEVLIMDDCSPDATPEVAQSFRDPRVKHIRNETNLKHLANYNKGISMARGTYVWLISADDCLRMPYVLERYVKVMDDHPEVGYVFCPAMAIKNGEETEIVQWSFHGTHDILLKGHDFLMRLLQSNCVTAPCGMVRKDCYKIDQFPLDMPYAGDWYLWCLFALYHDVAYLEEPMINYRLHDLSFTSYYRNEGIKENIADEINVRWQIMRKAETLRYKFIVRRCKDYIIKDYVNRIVGKIDNNYQKGLSFEDYDNSIIGHVRNKKEERCFRSMVLSGLADYYYGKHEFKKALSYYEKAMRENPGMLEARAKYAFLAMGGVGIILRNALSHLSNYFKRTRFT